MCVLVKDNDHRDKDPDDIIDRFIIPINGSSFTQNYTGNFSQIELSIEVKLCDGSNAMDNQGDHGSRCESCSDRIMSCNERGKCVVGMETIYCLCETGYTGDLCESESGIIII